MILHALEDDHAVARRLDAVVIDTEGGADFEVDDLRFDQPLGGFLERLLRLADAHRERTLLPQTLLDHELAEEMRLARATTAICTFVAGGLKKRPKYRSCWNVKHRRRLVPKMALDGSSDARKIRRLLFSRGIDKAPHNAWRCFFGARLLFLVVADHIQQFAHISDPVWSVRASSPCSDSIILDALFERLDFIGRHVRELLGHETPIHLHRLNRLAPAAA